jgi:hypothetical protein
VKRNESLDAVWEELEAAGVHYEIERHRRNTHFQVRFRGADGRPEVVIVASSSANQKSVRDARATIRRKLRAT